MGLQRGLDGELDLRGSPEGELDGELDLRGSPEGVPEGELDGELDLRGSPEGNPEDELDGELDLRGSPDGVEGTRAVAWDREGVLRALRMVRARRLAIALGASGPVARSR